MLERTHNLFLGEFREKKIAWDRFIEFLVADHNPLLMFQFKANLDWIMTSDLSEQLIGTYDPKLLRSETHDHLGEMYFEKIATKAESKGIEKLLRPPESLVDATIKIFGKRSKRPESIYDPEAGTGRWLMAVHSVSPESQLYGVEKNLRLYRIAFTNMAIRGINAYLLHADQQNHQLDIATENGEHNWEYANEWYSCQDKLKPITDYPVPQTKPESVSNEP